MIDDVLQTRGTEYGQAWDVTGELVDHEYVLTGLVRLVRAFPQAWYPWVMILNKLVRILTSPRKLDHWVDIAGYATLVVNHLKGETHG